VRVISHDRNFEKRFRGKVKVGVLFRETDAASKAMGDLMVRELRAVDPYVFGDHGLEVAAIELDADASVAEAISAKGSRVVFVCVGLDDVLPEVVALARSKRVFTIGATVEYVTEGLSFAVEVVNGKPKVVINLAASRAEGTKFTAQLLKLARLVD